MKVGLADDFAERNWIIIANGVVNRASLGEFDLRAQAEHTGQACLRIHVDRKNTIAVQSQFLRQMDGRRRLSCATLEVRNRDDLDAVVRPATRNKVLELLGAAVLRNRVARHVDLFSGVPSAATAIRFDVHVDLVVEELLAKVVQGHADQISCLGGVEVTQLLGVVGQE